MTAALSARSQMATLCNVRTDNAQSPRKHFKEAMLASLP